jgi:hypothetical protein
MSAVAVVSRLLTFVDIADEDDDGPDARRMSMSARHEAVLTDRRRVVLLDDRGWSEQLGVVGDAEPSRQEQRVVEPLRIWAYETAEEIERTARVVVGPDEPFKGHTQAEMEASHWDSLARVLQREGIEVEAAELRALPHDVELSDRVLARLGVPRREIR